MGGVTQSAPVSNPAPTKHVVQDLPCGLRLPDYFVKAITELYKAKAGPMGMSPTAFCELFKNSSDVGIDADSREFLMSIFRAFDTDNNKKMDISELLQMLDVILCGATLEKAEGMFKMIDYNKDGYISREELRNFMKSLSWTKDGPGREALVNTADEMFNAFDADGDGQLTKVEFLTGCQNNRSFPELIEDVIGKCVGKFK